jgi:phosphoserine phosphatase
MNGELGFEESLLRRVGMVRGLPIEPIRRLCLRLPINRGAQDAISELKDLGCTPAIVSGGFDILADRVASEVGIDIVYSNRFVLEGGRIVDVQRPIVTPEFKADVFMSLSKNMGLDPIRCIVVGDGANDIPMMDVAGLSIAFNAKGCVREKAKVVVESGDLRDIMPHVKRFKASWTRIRRAS